jgi:agmatinase
MKAWLKNIEEGLPGGGSGLFGLDVPPEDAQVMVVPVPWEVTTSYGRGTANGPEAIRVASGQLDLFDIDFGVPARAGIGLAESNSEIINLNKIASEDARKIISSWEQHGNIEALGAELKRVNKACARLDQLVESEVSRYLDSGKQVMVLGGDHSVPYGAIKALSRRYESFGILHIDAHHDLRVAYEGFERSHASIMFNVLNEISQVAKLVSVGVRDFSEQEYQFANSIGKRCTTFYDRRWKTQKLEGRTGSELCSQVVGALPEHVYVSIDIDGLDPRYCPDTGTPVPGGLELDEVAMILRLVSESGRRIIGGDLNEVSMGSGHNEFNANVGARVLYLLIGSMLKSVEQHSS